MQNKDMIIEKKGYSYNDLTIVPEVISDVSSRSECNPFIKENWLPIIASPMASVVNENNLQSFIDNGITPIVPRNIDLDRRESLMNDKQWVALSLKEFEFCFITEANKRDLGKHYFICVDIANGHMKSLYLTCRAAKTLADKYGYTLTIMTGNIANAETYKWISEFTYKDKNDKTHCVIDFIRVGIGGGSGCFIDGTKIKTINGEKNIEDISNEDKVLTIDGTYKNVLSTIRYKTNNLIKINNEIISTPNHKYFVIDKCNKNVVNDQNLKEFGYWVDAQNLDKNKHLLIKLE